MSNSCPVGRCSTVNEFYKNCCLMYASIHALTYFLQIKLLLYPPSEPAACTDGDPPDLHEKLMKSTFVTYLLT